MTSAIVCNCSSFCVDTDCGFYHNISIKDRKIVRKLYDGLVRPNKNEPNADTRRANCRFGQICWNKDCGFRHRLSFENRMTLINGFNDAKVESTKTEKVVEKTKVKAFAIPVKNGFDCLEEKVIEVPMSSWADMMEDC